MDFRFVIMLLAQVVALQASGREKRLVLHSDADIAQELVSLRAEMQALKTAYQTEMANFVSQVTSAVKGHGSTYIRWGKTTCGGGNETQLIYKGYMAGSYYNEGGSGPNHQCLPEDPTWGRYDDSSNSNNRAYIYGTEYEEIGDNIFGKHVFNEDIPCAACYVSGTTLMIPARTNCYPGWTVEYTGYLMAEYHARHRSSNYVCVDADPDFITRGAANTGGNLLYLVEGRCGTLVCPPYFDYRELACSVCSKLQ